MIITKTPFRISFSGGGSDLPSYYEKYGGCVLSASINKYMYISIHPYFDPKQTVLKYSKIEIVNNIEEIEHRIFNCALNELGIMGVEISCTADIPAGTGLGSSSTFTVGLLHTLYCYLGKYASKAKLAEHACTIEIDKIGSPIGKQDQYAAALGGLNFIQFNPDSSVASVPVLMTAEKLSELQESLTLFYLGNSRSANSILQEQNKNITDAKYVQRMNELCLLTQEMKNTLDSGDLVKFGQLLDKSWQIKRTLASGITSSEIDSLYEKALAAGAIGGKLLGAGGTGFLLFFCPPEKKERLRLALGLRLFDFKFEYTGTSVIYVGDKYWN